MTDENDYSFTKEEFETFLQNEYGITREDLDWLRSYHRSVSKYGDWVAKAIVTSVVIAITSGVITVLYLGVKSAIATMFK